MKESYKESQIALAGILGFAPSVDCLEDMAAQASEHAEVYFEQQAPVDSATEAEIIVATSDCKGVPMRKVDAPQRKHEDGEPRGKRVKKGQKNGQKRMACVGGVYSVAPFPRTVEEVLNEILRKEKQEQRPKPKNLSQRARPAPCMVWPARHPASALRAVAARRRPTPHERRPSSGDRQSAGDGPRYRCRLQVGLAAGKAAFGRRRLLHSPIQLE